MVSSAITVEGLTGKPNSAYAPMVMTTSWTSARIAAPAIFGSRRTEM